LTFQCGSGKFQFLLFGPVLVITVLKFLFVPCDEILVFIQLGFELGFAIDDFIFFVVSHLVSLDYKLLHFPCTVVNNLLKFVDLSVQQVQLVLMGIFQ
jgi:hypothetical protein